MKLDTAAYNNNTEPMLSHINVGTGVDCTIQELAKTIAEVVGFEGEILWDKEKPDGAPRKLLDVSRLRSLGWEAEVDLFKGLAETYEWFLLNVDSFRA